MEGNIYISSDDYLYQIKKNESFGRNIQTLNNIKPIWSLRGHDNSIEGIHIINNEQFATVSHDCIISFWNFEKKNLSNIKVQYPILSSSLNKRKKLMVVGLTNKDTNICVVDIEKYKLSEKINSKSDSIFCVNYFEDNIITCGSKSGSIILIDLLKKKNLYRYEEIEDCISSCSFNSTHSVHFFGTYKGNLSLFDFRNSLPIYKNKHFHSKHSINSVFSFNNCFFTAGSDCLIKKFDIRLFDEHKPLNVYIGHTSPVHYLSFSPKFSYFCSSSDNGSIRLWKNEEKSDSIQCICSPFLNEKKEENKKLLIVNTGNEKKKKVTSSSIISEKSFMKSVFLLKNKNLKKNEKEIGIDKRALTPNVSTTQKRQLSSMPKEQIFRSTKTKTKTNEVKSPFLFNLKENYGQKTLGPINQINNILNVQSNSRTRPSSSVNPPAGKTDFKSKRKEDENKKKNAIKIRESKQKETINTKTTINTKHTHSKLNNITTQENKSTTNKINIVLTENELPSVFKSEIEYAALSMLHHKNRVSSMDWLQHNVLSVSWDQTIKCWDLGQYIR